jgi:glucokinase
VIGAVDIGGTKIAVGMVDDCGRVLAQLESPTDAPRGFRDALSRIANMLRRTAEAAQAKISGIGIGCTGPVYPLTGVIGDVDFLPGWQGTNPVADLASEFQVAVAMENDADAAALGEAAWGSGKNKRSLVYVTIGTGIGGGIILDGKLYRGVDYSHPEIGHHVIDPSGPQCFCGAKGCWEVLARGPAIVEWLQKQPLPDSLRLIELDARNICEFAAQGVPVALKAVEREAHYLGLGLANLITLFSPDAIVLGGSVMKSAKLFLPGIRRVIQQNCGLVPYAKTEVTLASLGPDTALIGAARVWHHRFGRPGAEHAS